MNPVSRSLSQPRKLWRRNLSVWPLSCGKGDTEDVKDLDVISYLAWEYLDSVGGQQASSASAPANNTETTAAMLAIWRVTRSSKAGLQQQGL